MLLIGTPGWEIVRSHGAEQYAFIPIEPTVSCVRFGDGRQRGGLHQLPIRYE